MYQRIALSLVAATGMALWSLAGVKDAIAQVDVGADIGADVDAGDRGVRGDVGARGRAAVRDEARRTRQDARVRGDVRGRQRTPGDAGARARGDVRVDRRGDWRDDRRRDTRGDTWRTDPRWRDGRGDVGRWDRGWDDWRRYAGWVDPRFGYRGYTGWGGVGWPGYGFGGWGTGFGAGLGTGWGTGWGGVPWYGYYGTGQRQFAARPGTQRQFAQQDRRQFEQRGMNYRQMATQAFGEGEYEAAAQLAHHAIVENPQDGIAYLLASQALFAIGEYEGAAALIHQGASLLDPEEWGHVVENFRRYYPGGTDYVQQMDRLKDHIDDNPDDAAALFVRGYHFGYLGHEDAAIDDLTESLQILEGESELAAILIEEFGGDVPEVAERRDERRPTFEQRGYRGTYDDDRVEDRRDRNRQEVRTPEVP